MSQGTFSPLPNPGSPVVPATNVMAIIGLIVSIVGIFTCGVLSPIGLLLSLLGFIWRPRGLAVAGSIVGVLGCLLLAGVGYGMMLGYLGLRKAGESFVQEIETVAKLELARTRIEEFRLQNSALPSDQEGQALIADIQDRWQNGLHYKRLDDKQYEIRSAGADGQYHTGDDSIRTHAEQAQFDVENAVEDELEKMNDDIPIEEPAAP